MDALIRFNWANPLVSSLIEIADTTVWMECAFKAPARLVFEV
jgi:hypothetical protein